jgi:malonyl-CoA O-methyltransferase
MNTGYRLDKNKIKRSFAIAVHSYDAAAGLQRQVGDLLLEKFPLISSPGLILDLGCGTGYFTRRIAAEIPAAQIVALDIALPMLTASRQQNVSSPVSYLCADAEKLPFMPQRFQQIYSNLALQWCQDLPAVFADCERVLNANGQLVFTTFGTATLHELKSAWADVDAYPHVNEFYGAQAIGDWLRQAGFNSITVASEIFQLSYASVMDLMHELKNLGAHNVNFARARNTTTRRQLQQMIGSYEAAMGGSTVKASYEIIFVQARS